MKKGLVIATVLSVGLLMACGQAAPQTEIGGEAQPASVEETTNEESDAEVQADVEEAEPEIVLNANPAEASTEGISLEDLSVKAGSVVITIDKDFLPDVDTVGTADIQQGEACLEGGYDTNYYYGGEELVVYTVAKEGQQLVYDIYVTGSNYETAKGIKVGSSSRDDVVAAYGNPSSEMASSYIYGVNNGAIQAQFDFGTDDIVTAIDILKK